MGVVAALGAEARMLGRLQTCGDRIAATRDGLLVAVSGIGGIAAAAAALRLADAGATSLVSWGLAGGLDPALAAGTLCLPDHVLTAGSNGFATDHLWRERVAAALVGTPAKRMIVHGALLTSEHAIDAAAAKAAAFHRTGAVAVDMESYLIAEVAAVRRLPFIVVRAVVDTAADTVPQAVLAASAAGQVHPGRLLLELFRSPRDLAPLVRLALRYRAARQALVDVARSRALSPFVEASAGACGTL